jgi:hypothetical protein
MVGWGGGGGPPALLPIQACTSSILYARSLASISTPLFLLPLLHVLPTDLKKYRNYTIHRKHHNEFLHIPLGVAQISLSMANIKLSQWRSEEVQLSLPLLNRLNSGPLIGGFKNDRFEY